MATPYLSVIVPTYQRCDSVMRLLRALAQQTLAPEAYEVIISIDGSHDGTRERVKTFPAPYQLSCVWQSNSGRAAARNAGIRAAQGEVLVFFDDDMEPAPDCLESHWHAHPAGSRLTAIGAVPIRREAQDPPVAAYFAAKFDQHLVHLAQPGHQFVLRDFYSGHFSVRRAVRLEIGLFDESFRLYGNEDLELSWRLRKAGVQLSAYDRGSWRWRWTRNLLLALSQWRLSMPEEIIALVGWLERREIKRLHLCYRFVLDYLYWLGARQALRENRQIGHSLTSAADRPEA